MIRTILRSALITPLLLISIFSVAFTEEFRYDNKNKRDPFYVPNERKEVAATAKVPVKNLHLEGVILGKNERSMAVINGEVVYEGDKINDFTVKKIERDAVVLLEDNREIHLPIIVENTGREKRSKMP